MTWACDSGIQHVVVETGYELRERWVFSPFARGLGVTTGIIASKKGFSNVPVDLRESGLVFVTPNPFAKENSESACC